MSLKPALCTLAAIGPPMVHSPTNPTTTLSLDIASPSLRILIVWQPDRVQLLESARNAQYQALLVFGGDDLQTDRQTPCGEAARNRGGGLLSQIKRKGKRRPMRPVCLLGSRRREM